MPPEVAAEPGGLTLDRALEIKQGRGAPPSEQERVELDGLQASPFFAALVRQFEEQREKLRAMAELQKRVRRLPPSQQRRYGKVKVRDAPVMLRLVARTPTVHAPERRENVARPRRRRASARRTSPSRDPDDPEPGRAGPLEHHLHVVAPSAFRAELRRALGGAA